MDRRRPRRHGAAAADKRQCLFDRSRAGEDAGAPYRRFTPPPAPSSQEEGEMKAPNFSAFFDLSWARVFAVFLKELVQMRRDRPTFAIKIMMPVMQLVLFGFAINTDPRHMPAVVEM